MASFNIPIPADGMLYNANAPQAVLGMENGAATWYILIYGWRAGTFGNHLYKWRPGTPATWIELSRITTGRGSLTMENNQLWVWSSEPTGEYSAGREVHRVVAENISFTPEDKGDH